MTEEITPSFVAGEPLEGKRGPGRPRKDGSPAQPRDGKKRSSAARKDLTDAIGGVLAMLNWGFAFAPDGFRGDELTEVEITALAKAINAQAQASATLYKYLAMVLPGVGGSGGATLQLALVIAAIGSRRAVRHNLAKPIIYTGVANLASAVSSVPLEKELLPIEEPPSMRDFVMGMGGSSEPTAE